MSKTPLGPLASISGQLEPDAGGGRSVHQKSRGGSPGLLRVVKVIPVGTQWVTQEIPIPLFSSTVPAGFPSPADDYVECHLDLNQFLITHPAATFFVRVVGDSMIGASIQENDYLVVDRAIAPTHNAIVIAVVEQELTVKRLYKQGSVVELRSENPDYPPIRFTRGMELQIWGVVCGVFRKTV